MTDRSRSLWAAMAMACALVLAAPAPQAQTLFRPVAIVNDSAITGYDLAQRAQILVALGFTAADPDALRSAALDQLVEDRLKLQAGRDLGLQATDEQIEFAVNEFARRSDLSSSEFRAALSSQGVTDMALTDLARAEVVWSQVVRARFSNRVVPGEAEIDAELGDVQARAGVEYRVQEIGLPMTADGRTEAQTRALAEQLFVSLNAGGDFKKAVASYSRAPSAARGGDVGWISTQRMPGDVLQELSTLQPGQVSRPLNVPGGLSMLKLLEKRQPTRTTVQSDPQARERARQQLINRKSQRLAEGLLQELRRDALIEVR